MDLLLGQGGLKEGSVGLVAQDVLVDLGREVFNPQLFGQEVVFLDLGSNAVLLAAESEVHSGEGDGGVDRAYFVLNGVLLLPLVKRFMECYLLVPSFCIFDSVHRESKAVLGQKLRIADSALVSKRPELVGLVRSISVIRMSPYGLLYYLS